LFHPHRDDWTDHFAWNGDATEITASTASGRATILALRMNRPQLTRVRRMWVLMGEHPPDLD
jgi:recombinational DNA repair ATPase RecF